MFNLERNWATNWIFHELISEGIVSIGPGCFSSGFTIAVLDFESHNWSRTLSMMFQTNETLHLLRGSRLRNYTRPGGRCTSTLALWLLNDNKTMPRGGFHPASGMKWIPKLSNSSIQEVLKGYLKFCFASSLLCSGHSWIKTRVLKNDLF